MPRVDRAIGFTNSPAHIDIYIYIYIYVWIQGVAKKGEFFAQFTVHAKILVKFGLTTKRRQVYAIGFTNSPAHINIVLVYNVILNTVPEVGS